MPRMGISESNAWTVTLALLTGLITPAVSFGARDCVDYADFFNCLHGPSVGIGAECAQADLDSDGDLFVSNDDIDELDPAGNPVRNFGGDVLSLPIGLTFKPIPEPGTLCLLGLGALVCARGPRRS